VLPEFRETGASGLYSLSGATLSLNGQTAADKPCYNLRGKEVTLVLCTIEGIYRDGKIELLETPTDLDVARVIVTFLPGPVPVDLRARGIDEAQAADLRTRLKTFADDWERPDMESYDAL
jgi:hypothetical protein